MVLGLDRDDVVAPVTVKRRHAFDGEIVALGRAAGEDNFLAVSPKE